MFSFKIALGIDWSKKWQLTNADLGTCFSELQIVFTWFYSWCTYYVLVCFIKVKSWEFSLFITLH